MKNGGRCPKCGGTDVAPCASTGVPQDLILAGRHGYAETVRLVCCTCGYCELWVKEEDLKKIKAYWSGPDRR